VTHGPSHPIAEVSSDRPFAIGPLLKQLGGATVTETPEGFCVDAWREGADVRELNRELLSSQRRIERQAHLRSEWTASGVTHRSSTTCRRALVQHRRTSLGPDGASLRAVSDYPRTLSNCSGPRRECRTVRRMRAKRTRLNRQRCGSLGTSCESSTRHDRVTPRVILPVSTRHAQVGVSPSWDFGRVTEPAKLGLPPSRSNGASPAPLRR
jgi:hypothetical protein